MTSIKAPITASKRVEDLIQCLRDDQNTTLTAINNKSQNIAFWLTEATQAARSSMEEHVNPPRKKLKSVKEESNVGVYQTELVEEPSSSLKNEDKTKNETNNANDPSKSGLHVNSMKVKELRQQLSGMGLSTKGLKVELQQRLAGALESKAKAAYESHQQGRIEETMEIESPPKNDDKIELNDNMHANVANMAFEQMNEPEHVNEDIYKNSPEIVETASDKLKKENLILHNTSKRQSNPADILSLNTMTHFPKQSSQNEVDLPESSSASDQKTSEKLKPKQFTMSPKKIKAPFGKLVKATSKLFSPKKNMSVKIIEEQGADTTITETMLDTIELIKPLEDVVCDLSLRNHETSEFDNKESLSAQQIQIIPNSSPHESSKNASAITNEERRAVTTTNKSNIDPIKVIKPLEKAVSDLSLKNNFKSEFISKESFPAPMEEDIIYSGPILSEESLHVEQGDTMAGTACGENVVDVVRNESNFKYDKKEIQRKSIESVTSTASTSTRSTRHDEIRQRVREQQALKAKVGSDEASSTMKPSQKKISEMREKMREQAKANKVLTSTTSVNIQLSSTELQKESNMPAIQPLAIKTTTSHIQVATEGPKKKNIAALMREKAAAEVDRKSPGIMQVSVIETSGQTDIKESQEQPKLVACPMDSYDLSEREGSSSSDEDESEQEEERNQPKKRIPDWAQRTHLQKALEKQFSTTNGVLRIDPDEVFGSVYTCDLAAIFGDSKRYNKPRKETGDWRRDQVTNVERQTYKSEMGYK